MKVKLFRLFVFYIVLSCWIPHVASAEVVNMPDEALAAAVRNRLGLAPDAPITQQALQRLYGLGAPRRLESSRLIKDLTGLEHATALRTLDLLSHAVDDLRPLSGLRQLRYLRLDNNQLSDIAPLSGLWLLADLSLDNNQLSDITPLKSLKQLATLSLSQNQLSDITPLSDLTQLRWLSLDNNQLSDVTPLSGLWRLGYLRLDQNQIRDVTPLKGLKRLRYLRLNNNQIRDVTPIQHLIDSKNVSIRFDGNPIGEPLEGVNLVIESVTANKTTLTPGESFTLTATLKNRGVGKVEAPIYYRWHRSTHPNIHKMEGSDKVLTGAREEIGEKRTAVRSMVEFKKTEDVSLGTNQSSKQYIALTAPQESGTHYYSVCVESPPNENDESDNCSADVEITVVKPPDVVIQSFGASLQALQEGNINEITAKREITLKTNDEFYLYVRFKNEGTETSDQTQALYYQSDSGYTHAKSEPKITKRDLVSLSGNKDVSMELHQVAPDTPGIYSYHVCVEPVTGESKTENNCSDTVEITVNPVDHGGTWAEATRLPLRLTSDLWEGSLSGKMQKGSDVDYFKVEIPEDGKLTVWTTGDLTTFGKLSGSNISIDGDLEDFLDSRGGPGDNFQIQRDVSRGTYYVKVTAAGTGSYTIHARFAPNVPCDSPRVHVIWYRAANEELRVDPGPNTWATDYITPKNVKEQLEHLQKFFKDKIGKTFKYVTAPSNIVVKFIHSKKFYVSNPKVSIGVTYNPKIHFKDDEGSAGDFLDKVWNDIKTNHPTGLNLNPLKDIYLVLVQSEYGYLGEKKEDGAIRGIADIGGHRAMVALGPFTELWNDERVKLLIAHELGHAFGLYHDFDEQGHIMSYNWERAGPAEWWGLNDRLFANTFSVRSWNWLRIHPAFNTYTSCNVDTPIEIKVKVKDAAGFFHQPTTLKSYGYYLPDNPHVNQISVSDSNGVYKIHLDIADLDGLHQVELIVPPLENSKGCPAGGCGSDNLSLARYLSPNFPDEEGVSGNFSSGHTTWSGTFDITKWMEQEQERDMDWFFADIATTDKTGNRSGFRLRIYEASGSTASAPSAQKHLPKETALFVNYPNPFNPETWIPYQLAQPAEVTLTIYDIQGRVVRDLDLGHQRAGMYHNRSRAAHWDGKNAQGESVASGVYFYTLTAGDFSATRKLLIRK